MRTGYTTITKMSLILYLTVSLMACAAQDTSSGTRAVHFNLEDRLAVTASKAHRSSLSGIVVDATGAGIAGAVVEVQNTDGSALKITASDKDGAFTLLELPAGDYGVVVSSPGFEKRAVFVTVEPTGVPTPLRVSLAVSTVTTTIDVEGREDDLIGIADSATQGTVGASQLANRAILRSGEVLEAVPGLIITQHAGGGKANQYFLRGFNLDHGTDFAIFLDDMPLNLPSHAHGEGYSDMNSVIPEFVQRMNFEKGPYYADVGNYGSAGSVHLEFLKTLSKSFLHVEGGMYGFGRLVFGVPFKVGTGHLLLGGEAYHDDGPWVHPDKYRKFNGLASYSRGEGTDGFSLTARGYKGTWHSSDQIADVAVPLVGRFGTLDPSGGGHSQRYSLQGEWHRLNADSATKIIAYGFRYDLDLFSNFTYFLTDRLRGDQFEQQDKRWVGGLDARHTIYSNWAGRRVENSFGLQFRNDRIENGLYQDQSRVRVDKTDFETGNALPATTQAHRFTDLQSGIFAENRVRWTAKFRSVVAVRGDLERFHVTSLVNSANSGTASKLEPSPKLSLTFGPWANTEFYAQGGSSFHSNDGRGTTQTIEPISGENPYPNVHADRIPPLIPTKGAELGARTLAVPHLQSTLSIWYLHSASELQQSGDTGGTTASKQPSDRYGLEWANYFTPSRHWTVDFDLANSKALFDKIDLADAAPDSAGGRQVPEAVGKVISSGITMHDYKGLTSSLRLRYFGPRCLTSDAIFRSQATALVNGELEHGIGEHWRISAQFLNLLDRNDHDIDYAYESRVSPTATPAFTHVFHPVEPFQIRFSVGRSF